MNLKKQLEKAKKSVFKKAEQVAGTEIRGPDFEKELSIKKLVENYEGIGMQASNLAKAVSLIKKMREEKCTIFLAYTSSITSSGLREAVKYLVKNKLVHILVTTTAGIEEDIIKTLKPFTLGKFNSDGAELRKKGVNRIGNIFVPNDRYCLFEEWINPKLKEIFEKQKKGENLTMSKIAKYLGEKINKEESILYWTAKNNIPMFFPAPIDGSLGDMIYFFKQSNPEFKIDVTEDLKKLIDLSLNAEKTGMIILGAGTVKHATCNANLFRDGADYAVYINSAQEFDGSDAGATPDEAISWGKIKGNKDNSVKVHADATLVFPLIIEAAFK